MAQTLLRVSEDTFAALVRLFCSPANPKWMLPQPQGYSPATKTLWGNELAFAADRDCLGALSLQEIEPYLVQAFFDGISDRPGKCKASLAAMKQLEKWAIVRRLLPRQITLGVEISRSDGGHIPWTEAQVKLAEERLPPHLARWITLAANTGQRGSDLCRMGWTDLETFKGVEGIRLTQQKTGRRVWVPINSSLAAAMRTWERRPGPFLLRPDGQTWTRQIFYLRFVHARKLDPVLAEALIGEFEGERKRLVLHGLRGHACVQLRRGGLEIPLIADTIGMSAQMVERYCRFSMQQENAFAAVIKLERAITERKSESGS